MDTIRTETSIAIVFAETEYMHAQSACSSRQHYRDRVFGIDFLV
jgi:hypothetical protein